LIISDSDNDDDVTVIAANIPSIDLDSGDDDIMFVSRKHSSRARRSSTVELGDLCCEQTALANISTRGSSSRVVDEDNTIDPSVESINRHDPLDVENSDPSPNTLSVQTDISLEGSSVRQSTLDSSPTRLSTSPWGHNSVNVELEVVDKTIDESSVSNSKSQTICCGTKSVNSYERNQDSMNNLNMYDNNIVVDSDNVIINHFTDVSTVNSISDCSLSRQNISSMGFSPDVAHELEPLCTDHTYSRVALNPMALDANDGNCDTIQSSLSLNVVREPCINSLCNLNQVSCEVDMDRVMYARQINIEAVNTPSSNIDSVHAADNLNRLVKNNLSRIPNVDCEMKAIDTYIGHEVDHSDSDTKECYDRRNSMTLNIVDDPGRIDSVTDIIRSAISESVDTQVTQQNYSDIQLLNDSSVVSDILLTNNSFAPDIQPITSDLGLEANDSMDMMDSGEGEEPGFTEREPVSVVDTDDTPSETRDFRPVVADIVQSTSSGGVYCRIIKQEHCITFKYMLINYTYHGLISFELDDFVNFIF